MLKARNAIVVFNPYENMFPSYGESTIECTYKNGDLLINLIFDGENSGKEEQVFLIFKNAVFYKVESFPNIDSQFLDYDESIEQSMGSLMRFDRSEFKDEWEKHFNNLFSFSHYKIYFLNVNKSIEVVSENYQIDLKYN